MGKQMTFALALAAFLWTAPGLHAQHFSEWRGPDRSGQYPDTNLMTQWPEQGPPLLWMNTELPKGFSSLSFGNGLVYLTGVVDSIDVLVALNQDSIQWTVPIGRAWMESFSDSRATPTVDGDRIYISSGFGDLACIDAVDGAYIWTRKASEDYGGTYPQWGLAESLLVDDKKVYFTPGGQETTTIALDKENGELLWKSASLGDNPAYVSPIFVDRGEHKMLVNVSASYIFGVDLEDGGILWSIKHLDVNGEKSRAVWPDAPLIKCVTPLYRDGEIYVTGGYDHGSMKLALSDSGEEVSLVWTDSVLDVHLGGTILLGEHIYGSNWLHNGDGNWCCLDWETGELLYEQHWNNKGSLIAADGMIYIYEEKRGHVALVEPTPEEFRVISSFRVPEGSGPHWAHPAIHEGALYVRHGNALMVYDLSEH